MAVDPDNSADDLNAQEIKEGLGSPGFRPVIPQPSKPITVGEPFEIKEIPEAVTPVPMPDPEPVYNEPVANPDVAKMSIFDEIKHWISELSEDVRAGVIAHFVEQEKTQRVSQIVEALTASKNHQKVVAALSKPDTVIKNIEGTVTHQGFTDKALAARKEAVDAHTNLQNAIGGALKGDMSKLTGAVAKVKSLQSKQ